MNAPRRVGDGKQRRQQRRATKPKKSPADILAVPGMAPDSLRATMLGHLESLDVRNYSPRTIRGRATHFRIFVTWCEERALLRPAEVTRPILERYQRHLFYSRKSNGAPLSVEHQLQRLTHLRLYFSWLCRQGYLPANPAADLELPRLSTRLPLHSLSRQDVEKLLATPDISTLAGLRDRAMLEVLWATGLRRSEATSLNLFDIQEDKGVVFVRQGKGKKDRVVPMPPRTFEWIQRYIRDARARYVGAIDDGALFLGETGERMSAVTFSARVRTLLQASGFKGKGSCHLLRHACATAMLEGGADSRFVQELLGHASLESTQIYTRVSITKLKAVYAACHPVASGVADSDDSGGDAVTAADVLQQLDAAAEVEEE